MSIECMINSCLESINKAYGFEFYVTDMRKIREKYLKLLSTLSEKEIEHFDALKIEKNRIQWISGRYAVKSALFKYKLERAVLMDFSCIDVLKGEDSAPYISQYPDMCVSITHSFPYCIGLVANKNIGIDIEKISELKESLISHFYSTQEKVILEDKKGTNEYWQQAIILWTRKEAVSKLLKLGMQMDFKRLDTSIDTIVKGNCLIRLKSFICGEFALSIASEE